MKQDVCQKCRKVGHVEKHHILPQATFGKNKETVKPCPNSQKNCVIFIGVCIFTPALLSLR